MNTKKRAFWGNRKAHCEHYIPILQHPPRLHKRSRFRRWLERMKGGLLHG